MYDFQIIVPCVKERLEIFQKFGLYNIQKTKILVYCLVDNKEEYLDGWPKEVDVKIIEDEYKNEEKLKKNKVAGGYPNYAFEVFRLYNFLSKFTLDQAKQAKWTLKIDDDCYNDFHLMNYYFEKNYDYEKDFYLVGEVRKENDNPEIECLRNLGVWKDNIERTGWCHEIEFCALSKCSMERIVQNEMCKKLFKMRSEITKGYTDQTLGLAAHLCKIYPISSNFIEASGNNDQFNLLSLDYDDRFVDKGGPNIQDRCFVHFHPIKQDRYIKLQENIEIAEATKKIKEKYKSKVFKFK